MKISSTIKLASILIKEQFREPIGIFWSLIAPAGFFCFANWTDKEAMSHGSHFMLKAAWYLAYISFTTALFGFGLYLVGRRESGFVRSFAYSRRARSQFISAQLCASLTLALAYGVFFLLIASVTFQANLNAAEVGIMFLRFTITTAVLMMGCLIFSTLPLTFQNASNLMSIFSMPLIMLGLASQHFAASGLGWINNINPYFAAGFFVANPLSQLGQIFPVGHAVLCLMLGCFALLHFRINPVWSRY